MSKRPGWLGLAFIMGIFYFILVWRRLKSIKLKKKFFLPTFNKFAIQNNPLTKLCLIFHRAVNKNKLKAWKFQSHRLSSFLAIKEIVTRVEGGAGKFVLFWLLFLSIHINFHYKLSSHKSLFIITVDLCSSIALPIFSHQ